MLDAMFVQGFAFLISVILPLHFVMAALRLMPRSLSALLSMCLISRAKNVLILREKFRISKSYRAELSTAGSHIDCARRSW